MHNAGPSLSHSELRSFTLGFCITHLQTYTLITID